MSDYSAEKYNVMQSSTLGFNGGADLTKIMQLI